jgi:membrane fusion protein, multidrug efflux system
MNRRSIIVAVAAVVLVAVAVWGYGAWHSGRQREKTEDAQVDGRIIPVLNKVAGYVARVNVSENQTVRLGDTILVIDDAELRVRLAQAEAELAAAQAMAGSGRQVGQAAAASEASSGQQASLEAQLDAARVKARQARADYARIKGLADKQIVSRQALDAAQATVDAADASVTVLERQVTAAGASVTGAEAGVRLARARYEAARATRGNAALQLSYATVVAPASGLVARKTVDVGQLLQAGQPVLSIVAADSIWVTANYKETQVAVMHPGQEVDLAVDAYPDCHMHGKLESISSATGARFALIPPDNATGNFTKVVQRVPVRIQVLDDCGEDRPLRPGMSVEAVVHTGGSGGS